MKKLKIFAVIIFIQLAAVLALTAYNNSSLSKAVVWNITEYKLTAVLYLQKEPIRKDRFFYYALDFIAFRFCSAPANRF